ncbi:DUF1508 domain-containing protein [Nannocystis sp. RBIL2]|uniref:DUF1508 domain-containing protein n=1 Tax=Nannocystis sp. RBIL2 TaxID=2996788 RepID=UPI00226E3E20|nr:DUF1508 domain-containing protein [Nannocystis sp. RBIL2]MCY1066330.1 DUF1508 domain-containing protein [Nannocystis sp. RBIL2]
MLDLSLRPSRPCDRPAPPAISPPSLTARTIDLSIHTSHRAPVHGVRDASGVRDAANANRSGAAHHLSLRHDRRLCRSVPRDISLRAHRLAAVGSVSLAKRARIRPIGPISVPARPTISHPSHPAIVRAAPWVPVIDWQCSGLPPHRAPVTAGASLVYFRVVQQSRDALAFQVVLEGERVGLTSVEFRDQAAVQRAIEAVIASLREGVDASLQVDGDSYHFTLRGEDGELLARGIACPSPAEADAGLAEMQRWAATGERFRVINLARPQKSGARPVDTIQVAVRYDLAACTTAKKPGLELLNRASDGLFTAHVHGERGEVLLYLRGFTTRFARDEQVESVLGAAADPRRYDRREAEGRRYFVLTARNGREIARSPWLASEAECDAAIAQLVRLAPIEAKEYAGARTRRKVAESGYDLTRRSTSGVAGFEAFKAEDGHHYFHLNDERGEALLFSHGYSTPKARDHGIRSLLKGAGDPVCYRVAADELRFAISAVNGRELARSRLFGSRAALDRAIAWIRSDIIPLGRKYGIRLWESSFIELPPALAGGDDGAPAQNPDELARQALDASGDATLSRLAPPATPAPPVSRDASPHSASDASPHSPLSAAGDASPNSPLPAGDASPHSPLPASDTSSRIVAAQASLTAAGDASPHSPLPASDASPRVVPAHASLSAAGDAPHSPLSASDASPRVVPAHASLAAADDTSSPPSASDASSRVASTHSSLAAADDASHHSPLSASDAASPAASPHSSLAAADDDSPHSPLSSSAAASPAASSSSADDASAHSPLSAASDVSLSAVSATSSDSPLSARDASSLAAPPDSSIPTSDASSRDASPLAAAVETSPHSSLATEGDTASRDADSHSELSASDPSSREASSHSSLSAEAHPAGDTSPYHSRSAARDESSRDASSHSSLAPASDVSSPLSAARDDASPVSRDGSLDSPDLAAPSLSTQLVVAVDDKPFLEPAAPLPAASSPSEAEPHAIDLPDLQFFDPSPRRSESPRPVAEASEPPSGPFSARELDDALAPLNALEFDDATPLVLDPHDSATFAAASAHALPHVPLPEDSLTIELDSTELSTFAAADTARAASILSGPEQEPSQPLAVVDAAPFTGEAHISGSGHASAETSIDLPLPDEPGAADIPSRGEDSLTLALDALEAEPRSVTDPAQDARLGASAHHTDSPHSGASPLLDTSDAPQSPDAPPSLGTGDAPQSLDTRDAARSSDALDASHRLDASAPPQSLDTSHAPHLLDTRHDREDSLTRALDELDIAEHPSAAQPHATGGHEESPPLQSLPVPTVERTDSPPLADLPPLDRADSRAFESHASPPSDREPPATPLAASAEASSSGSDTASPRAGTPEHVAPSSRIFPPPRGREDSLTRALDALDVSSDAEPPRAPPSLDTRTAAQPLHSAGYLRPLDTTTLRTSRAALTTTTLAPEDSLTRALDTLEASPADPSSPDEHSDSRPLELDAPPLAADSEPSPDPQDSLTPALDTLEASPADPSSPDEHSDSRPLELDVPPLAADSEPSPDPQDSLTRAFDTLEVTSPSPAHHSSPLELDATPLAADSDPSPDPQDSLTRALGALELDAVEARDNSEPATPTSDTRPRAEAPPAKEITAPAPDRIQAADAAAPEPPSPSPDSPPSEAAASSSREADPSLPFSAAPPNYATENRAPKPGDSLTSLANLGTQDSGGFRPASESIDPADSLAALAALHSRPLPAEPDPADSLAALQSPPLASAELDPADSLTYLQSRHLSDLDPADSLSAPQLRPLSEPDSADSLSAPQSPLSEPAPAESVPQSHQFSRELDPADSLSAIAEEVEPDTSGVHPRTPDLRHATGSQRLDPADSLTAFAVLDPHDSGSAPSPRPIDPADSFTAVTGLEPRDSGEPHPDSSPLAILARAARAPDPSPAESLTSLAVLEPDDDDEPSTPPPPPQRREFSPIVTDDDESDESPAIAACLPARLRPSPNRRSLPRSPINRS